MNPQNAGDALKLSGIVQALTRASEQLAGSYRSLEQRVKLLNDQLATLSAERVQQVTEKERLANRMEQLLNVLPAGVVVLDGSGNVQQCNPAAIELLGEPLQGALWRDVIRRAFAPRLDDGHEVSLRDGRRAIISTQPLGTEPGQILLLTDVTETRLLQARVSQHKRLSDLAEMAAALAHQIRTPLAAALLYAANLAKPELPPSEQQRFVDKLLDRLRHLDRLIQDVLSFARGGGGEEDSTLVDELLADVQQALDADVRLGAGRLQVSNQAPGVRLRGKRDMLLTALQNLANNALQACDRGARMQVLARPAGNEAVDLRVVDDGPGIAPELQERVFEPFFTTRSEGTGLGLAVVRAIARSYQGAVWIDSVPGSGCAITLRLPRIREPRSASALVGAGAAS